MSRNEIIHLLKEYVYYICLLYICLLYMFATHMYNNTFYKDQRIKIFDVLTANIAIFKLLNFNVNILIWKKLILICKNYIFVKRTFIYMLAVHAYFVKK